MMTTRRIAARRLATQHNVYFLRTHMSNNGTYPTTTIPRHGQCGPLVCYLIERLRAGKPGDIETRDALNSAVAGAGFADRDLWANKHRGPLLTARNYVCRHYGLNWQPMYGEHAIKCFTSTETVSKTSARLKGLRKSALRTSHQLGTVQADELGSQSSPYRAQAAILGTIVAITSSDARRELEQKPGPEPLKLSTLLDAWK